MSIYAYASIAIYFRLQHPCLEATTCIKDHCHTSSNVLFVALIFFWITFEQKTFSNCLYPELALHLTKFAVPFKVTGTL